MVCADVTEANATARNAEDLMVQTEVGASGSLRIKGRYGKGKE